MCIKFICEFCGREHEGTYGSGRFCSSICKNKYISRGMSGEGNPRWIPRTNKYICKNCGIKHDGTYGRTKSFCSEKCSYKYRGKLLSERQRGKNNPNAGGLSEEHKRKIGLANLGKTNGQVPWNKGLTKETDERVAEYSEKILGRTMTEESKKSFKKKMKEYYKSHDGYWKGKHLSEETRKKLSESHKGKKRPNYKYIEDSDHICDYGCGEKACYHFFNGKWCCSKHYRSCPGFKYFHSEKTKKKMSKSRHVYYETHDGYFKGRHFSEEHKKRIGLKHKNKKVSLKTRRKLSISVKKLYENEEYIPWKNWKGRISSLEGEMMIIIKKNKLPFKYVGDRSFWLTSKGKHLNPDFIYKNKNKKIAIEVFGSYFKKMRKGSVENYIKERNDLFENIGWKCLFFEGEEGKLKKSDEEIIRMINDNLI